MILLSNHRLIPIKQIQFPQTEHSKKEEEQNLQSIQSQIEYAQYQLNEVQLEIEQKRELAEEEIQHKRAQWEQEREGYIEQAQQHGYQQGFDQGKKDSVHQYEQLLEEAKKILDKSNEEYKKIISASDETILQIAMAVSEKIIKQSLEEDRSKFLGITKALIEQVKQHPQITLFVSGTYYSLLVDNKDELSSIILDQVEFRIYPSADLINEQVMIETPFGRIDASIDSQLEEIKTRLFHVMEGIMREQSYDSGRN